MRFGRFETSNADGGVTHVWVHRRTLTGTQRLLIAMIRERRFRRLTCPEYYTIGAWDLSLQHIQSIAALRLARAGLHGP